jgi:ketosteroid isomerase-like protein
MIVRRACALALIGVMFSCAHQKIQDTQIDDTPENREILDLIRSYHRAIESRDADAVLAMVSHRYYEDNGNTDQSDDYNFAQLSDTLKQDFERTKAMQLELRVDDIVIEEDTAEAFIFYTVRGHAEFPAGTKWKTNTDRARITFTREDGAWKIISGL